eukprot:COSAG02_NODE_3173_length_7227_cov_35.536336_6_plen_211_part_00
MQQLPADFSAVSGASGIIRKDFAEWLDSPRNHEVALHLVRELIERYTTVHFEDVLGAAAGPRRAESGITHAADLLGEDGVKQTFGSQVRSMIIIVPDLRSQLTSAATVLVIHRTQLQLLWPLDENMGGGHRQLQLPSVALCKISSISCWQDEDVLMFHDSKGNRNRFRPHAIYPPSSESHPSLGTGYRVTIVNIGKSTSMGYKLVCRSRM